jgi:crotonobetainyl-CoA:carnitine CoA-transferase CaiB-like acyl-CoA transferase
VRTLKDAFDDPFAKERGQVLTDESGNRHLGPPIRFLHESAQPSLVLPTYGEHSETIAAQAGLSPTAVAELKANGTI